LNQFRRVSRFGEMPKPTVIVRMIENGKSVVRSRGIFLSPWS
jgi:hypothetical protein